MNHPELWTNCNTISRSFANDLSQEFEEEHSKMSGRVLDVGSGPCDVTIDFVLPKLNPNATIVCSDISTAMMEFGKKKYKDNKRVSFMKLDIETPDLPKDLIEQFDHLTSYYCLHMCQNMRQIFENFFNLIRPGGTIVLAFISHSCGFDCYKDLAVMPRYQPYMKDAESYIPFFQHSEHPQKTLKTIMEEVGFEVHHCSSREKTWTFDNIDRLADLLIAVNVFVDRMPADLKKEYRKDLAKEFAKRSFIFNKNNDKGGDQSILVVFRTLVIHLTKPLAK